MLAMPLYVDGHGLNTLPEYVLIPFLIFIGIVNIFCITIIFAWLYYKLIRS